MDKEFSLSQINARMFVLEREWARANEQKIKIEEHCTLILGKFLLAQLRKRYGQKISLSDAPYLTLGDTSLDEWLVDDSERRVFGLPSRDDQSRSTPVSPALSSNRVDYSSQPYSLDQPYTLSSLTVYF
ncbi:hypothetical protein [Paraburkholderia dinghuensis]|uniref:Uncharacterized protein n=1 Tax=Paraburkholderia dinghuensis TaxID=2305225 RepID=A0A3N6PY71_9BURK|nr:hypothetical protein [Paraburkholderia dinghuensis]RQH07390.1 hypothetical protein D1Y85_08340 [Paraburkholderia dinghuensis]